MIAKPHRITAFTLTELLVVTAIIAVLAALLVPAYRDGVQRFYRVACANNLRSIATAFHNRNADRSPETFEPITWPSQLRRYLDETEGVYQCPNDPDALAFGATDDPSEPEDPPVDPEDTSWRDLIKPYQICTINPLSSYDQGWQYFVPGFALKWYTITQHNDLVSNPACTDGDMLTDTTPETSTVFYVQYEDWHKSIVVGGSNYWDANFRIERLADRIEGHYSRSVTTIFSHRLTYDPWYNGGDGVTPPEVAAAFTLGGTLPWVDYNHKVIEVSLSGTQWEQPPPEEEDEESSVYMISYGLNSRARQLTATHASPDKILGMEYCEDVVIHGSDEDSFLDDWSGDIWRDDSGALRFARHRSMANVVFANGSVKLICPGDIDPQLQGYRDQYWNP